MKPSLLSKPYSLQKYTVRMNSNNIYYALEENSYRDIRGGLDLLSLVSNDDVM